MGIRVRWAALAAAFTALGIAAPVARAADAPAKLTVGDRERPLNVEGTPRFGWMPSSTKGDDVQTAYELQVTKPGGSAVWDSGKVDSAAQSYVPYAGPALDKGASYDWTVRTWDRDGEASPYAPAAHFDTGLTDAGWSGAQWIRRITTGNDSTDDYTLARKQFSVGSSPVTRARVYTSAMGQYEVHVNGKTIGRGENHDYPGEAQYYAYDVTSAVTAGRPLALGVMYHYWTCTCQGRANGPASNTTLSAAAAAGATTAKVASVAVFDAGDQATIDGERVTVTAVGTAGAGGTGITFSPALASAHSSGRAVIDVAGPSALIAKTVVDHADGTRETFVTDGTWKVSKAAQFTNGTITRRTGDSGDNAERYDARAEQPGWDTAGFDDSAWQPAYAIGAHPRPVNPLRDELSHMDPTLSELDYDTVHPVSVRTLADGSVVADFGHVITAMPRLDIADGTSGTALALQTSFRLNNTTLSAAAAAGDTAIKVASGSNFVAGDRITVDQAANGFGAGDPEVRTIASVSGTTITLDAPLAHDHANARYVEGSRAGTSTHDTQGGNLGWWYTEKDGAQTAQTLMYWAWRYLQILPPGSNGTVTPDEVSAVVQHAAAPADRRATFDSDNQTLNDVFTLLQRSGEYASNETFTDTPTREKGQFTGDTSDTSLANMVALGDRNATARAIREIVYSATHSFKAASSGYCTSAQVPCSFSSIGTPGRVNAVYPNGDNMRDIPDYTEFVPGWVWRYYQLSGDVDTLARSYDSLKGIADYLHTYTAAGTGLITNLLGGSGQYQYGIIDWPAPMRYGYTFTGNAARTIHNAEAVGALRAVASAARTLGHDDDAAIYEAWAGGLTDAMNAKLIRPDGLYTDGLTIDGAQIDNHAQQAQSYPIYYGIAPAADRDKIADDIVAQGMHQGPMTWHVLLSALADSGRYDQIVKLMTDANADGPARILAEHGTFMWETWNPGCDSFPCNPTTNASESHGWGSWGVVDMVESLLGVKVTGTAGAAVEIAPPAVDKADLHRVSGSAWTQRGSVGVSWRKTGGGYVLDVDVPDNVTATVEIPNAEGRTYVGVGAGAPKFAGQQDGRAVFTVGSGATHFSIGATAPGTVGGSVPATLSLTLGGAASFGAFTPGVAKDYAAQTTATVTSTAGDAALSTSAARLSNGAFSLLQPVAVTPEKSNWSGPVSNDSFAVGFKQSIGAGEPLRTGSYSATVTFTLSTTQP